MKSSLEGLLGPLRLPIWGMMSLWLAMVVGTLCWLENLTTIAEASYCFMDAVLWVDGLINFQYGDVISGQVEGDRPPLSLWMGAWLYAFGYSEVQALQMVARLSFSVLVATTLIGLLRWTSPLVIIGAVGMMMGSSAFGKLIIWLNAEMLVNALFVVHLFVGWSLLRAEPSSVWQRRGWLVGTGLVAGLAVCAKEQGILLFPLSVLGVVGLTWSGWRSAFARLGWYMLGAVPLLGWYGVHLYAQWIYGEKWKIFTSDLSLMAGATDFDGQMQLETTWGSFGQRFGLTDSWWSFLDASSSSLMQDMKTPILFCLGFSLFTAVSLWARNFWLTKPTTVRWGEGIWIFVHLLAVVPLIVVPIFEPYHYTVLWAPAVILLAWSTQVWLDIFRWKGLLALSGLLWFTWNGSSIEQTLQLERETCISTRIMSVRGWMRQQTSRRATLWVTDSLTQYDKAIYPQRAKAYSQYEGECSYQDYVATSGLSNEAALFASEREQFPKAWSKVHEVVSINKEVWQIYRAVCHERVE